MKGIDKILMAFCAASLLLLAAVVNGQFAVIDDLRADLHDMETECAK